MRRKKIISAILLASLCASTLSGCGGGKKTGGEGLSSKINIEGNNVDVIDDMADWTGKEMNLVYWFCNGESPSIGKKASDTTVMDELTRISGISWDTKNSFDNNGDTGDTKISKIIATGDWPDIAYNLQSNIEDKLAENDKIWDLTEYIPKYMDNYMKIVNANEKTKKAYENLKKNGKMWSFTVASSGAAPYMNPEYNEKDYQTLTTPEESRSWVWVRDDIVKMLYPEAKTQAEIKQMYMEKGEFTEEDMTDVTIKGYEGLRELLEKINDLGLTENGRKVWPFFTHNGGDNWNLLTQFNGINGAPNGMADYFVRWDAQEKKLVRTIDDDYFKKQMKFYYELVRDGLASKEALIDNKSAFDQKKNNGEYAVIYGNEAPPTDEALKAAGKTYSYRKVLLDVDPDYTKFLKINNWTKIFDGVRWTVFKDGNIKTEEDLEQLLRYIDFFYSEAGQKFSYWGPEKAGLYTIEEDGTYKYTDEELEQNRVYDNGSDALVKYGFSAWPPIASNFAVYTSKYNPKVQYAKRGERTEEQYSVAWRYSAVEPAPSFPDAKTNFSLWNWTSYVPELKTFWDARSGLEDTIKIVFSATNDEEFEKFFVDMVAEYEQNGLTEEVMDKLNEQFKIVNADYLDDIINWTPNAE